MFDLNRRNKIFKKIAKNGENIYFSPTIRLMFSNRYDELFPISYY